MPDASSLTPAFTAAQDLAPAIAARAGEIEEARRLPADLARTMARAGLFRMLVPQDVGGLELAPAAALGAIETVAAADATAGWCTMIAATTAVQAAYLPADFARTVYGPADAIGGGVFAPMGTAVRQGDTYVASGRWPWTSGAWNCDWLAGSCVIVEDGEVKRLPNGQPDQRMLYWPAAQATLIDTWQVMGLKGTGSVDMAVEGVVVPVAHSVSLMTDQPRSPGPLYAFPVFGLLAQGIAAVALGNARGALTEFVQLAASKKAAGSSRTLAERGTVQAALAEAEAQVRAARAYTLSAVEAAYASATAGNALSLAERAELRLSATHAARTSADAVRTVHDLAGGAGVYLSGSLQRRLRDAQTMTAHIMVSPSTYELTGRTVLGLPTDATTL
jgi:alkylation response protein AidB-like acyl-CoA dehydrogenase